MPITDGYKYIYYNKTMQLTEKHTFNISKKQKETLILLHKKYKINTSNFIREAINEKLKREKDTIFKNHKDIQQYLKDLTLCPF